MHSTLLNSSVIPAVLTTMLLCLQPVASQENTTNCIRNYAELKEAIFKNGTGNMERLLYTFKPPNSPPPHYIWVYFFHNESSDWSDILECPPSSVPYRCPETVEQDDDSDSYSSGHSPRLEVSHSHEDGGSYHLIFWGDSPLLINFDIPLLRMFTLNSVLQYLLTGSCVQLITPPICDSLGSNGKAQLLKFATSWLWSYSTDSVEDHRDYVLDCDNKFGREFLYDIYIFGSEIIICVGSCLMFVSFSLKFCRHKQQRMMDAIKTRGTCTCTTVDTSFLTSKKSLSIVLIVNISALLILIIDVLQIVENPSLIRDAFLYGYGIMNITLFGLAFLPISFIVLFAIPSYHCLLFVVGQCFQSISYFPNFVPKQQLIRFKCNKYLNTRLLCTLALTLLSLMYVASRVFLISLARATYPFEVGFLVLAIGSGFLALLFIVWTIVHVAVENCETQVRIITMVISILPYVSLVVIMAGFLLSYIFMIVRLNIRAADPVMALTASLIPIIIVYSAANQFEKEKKKLNRKARGEAAAMRSGDEHPTPVIASTDQAPKVIASTDQAPKVIASKDQSLKDMIITNTHVAEEEDV